jgi:hypothetical protein
MNGFFQELDLLKISCARFACEEMELHDHPLVQVHPSIETRAETFGHLLAIGQAPGEPQDDEPF